MGFGMSPFLQEQICRLGSKLTFSESEEEFEKLLGVDVNIKQIERVCHKYGNAVDSLDRESSYQDRNLL